MKRLIVTLAVGTLLSACGGSPTSPTLQTYEGAWNIVHMTTNATGACAGGGGEPLNAVIIDSPITVNSSGTFTSDFSQGTLNLSSGAWTWSGSEAGCRNDNTATFSASGSCSSFTACSGTYSETSSPSGSTESGTVTWSRSPTAPSGSTVVVSGQVAYLGTLTALIDPAVGATVSTSLSPNTATTDATGAFALDTGVTALPANKCQTYSVTFDAPPAYGITNPQILHITLGPATWRRPLSFTIVLQGRLVSPPMPPPCM